jgi:MFS family permease
MSASPGPDAAGDRDGPGPVAAVRRPWLTRNVAVLCGVSFLQDTASELLYPILPVFLTAVLGAPVAVVGITEGAADGAAALAKVAAGRLADRTGRRPLIAAGYGLARGRQGAHRPGLRVAAGPCGQGHRPDRQRRAQRAP